MIKNDVRLFNDSRNLNSKNNNRTKQLRLASVSLPSSVLKRRGNGDVVFQNSLCFFRHTCRTAPSWKPLAVVVLQALLTSASKTKPKLRGTGTSGFWSGGGKKTSFSSVFQKTLEDRCRVKRVHSLFVFCFFKNKMAAHKTFKRRRKTIVNNLQTETSCWSVTSAELTVTKLHRTRL